MSHHAVFHQSLHGLYPIRSLQSTKGTRDNYGAYSQQTTTANTGSKTQRTTQSLKLFHMHLVSFLERREDIPYIVIFMGLT